MHPDQYEIIKSRAFTFLTNELIPKYDKTIIQIVTVVLLRTILSEKSEEAIPITDFKKYMNIKGSKTITDATHKACELKLIKRRRSKEDRRCYVYTMGKKFGSTVCLICFITKSESGIHYKKKCPSCGKLVTCECYKDHEIKVDTKGKQSEEEFCDACDELRIKLRKEKGHHFNEKCPECGRQVACSCHTKGKVKGNGKK